MPTIDDLPTLHDLSQGVQNAIAAIPDEQQALIDRLSDDERAAYNILEKNNWNYRPAAKEWRLPNGKSRFHQALHQYEQRHKNLSRLHGYYQEREWLTKLAKAIKEDLDKLPDALQSLVTKSGTTTSRLFHAPVPLILPRRALQAPQLMEFIPSAAFCILLIIFKDAAENRAEAEEPLSIQRESLAGELRYVLHINTSYTHAPLGIYNNAGKRCLRDRYHLQDPDIRNPLREASNAVHTMLMQRPEENANRRPAIRTWTQLFGNALSWRWASGGILPIVTYRGRRWVALFFRDIPPIGWNVANGASETIDETVLPEQLIRREFAEELMVLRAMPRPNHRVEQVVLLDHVGGIPVNPQQGVDYAKTTEFLQAHATLRQTHDNVTIFHGTPDTGIRFATQIQNTRHYRIQLSDTNNSTVIWSINPMECGIEAIRMYQFNMNDNEWLTDGEVFPGPASPVRWLVRRPVALFSLDFLKARFQNGHASLGTLLNVDESLECKQLDATPRNAQDFKLFMDFTDGDCDLRRRRLTNIANRVGEIEQELQAGAAADQIATLNQEKSGLTQEKAMITRWLTEYGEAFQCIRTENEIKDPRLIRLCPVTWKTLEIAFANGYH